MLDEIRSAKGRVWKFHPTEKGKSLFIFSLVARMVVGMELTIFSSGTGANTFLVAEERGPKNTTRLYNLRPGPEMAHFFYIETLLSVVNPDIS